MLKTLHHYEMINYETAEDSSIFQQQLDWIGLSSV